MGDGKPDRKDTDVVMERIGAQIIDNITQVFLAVATLLVFAATADMVEATSQPLGGVFAATGITLFILIALGYSAILEYRWKGQTVGKRLTGIQVVKENGEQIGWKEAILRNIPVLAFIIPYIGMLLYTAALVSMAATDRRQRLFDRAAGTVVIGEE